jgi:hypothetical protein
MQTLIHCLAAVSVALPRPTDPGLLISLSDAMLSEFDRGWSAPSAPVRRRWPNLCCLLFTTGIIIAKKIIVIPRTIPAPGPQSAVVPAPSRFNSRSTASRTDVVRCVYYHQQCSTHVVNQALIARSRPTTLNVLTRCTYHTIHRHFSLFGSGVQSSVVLEISRFCATSCSPMRLAQGRQV